jgi:hypothetical protein
MQGIIYRATGPTGKVYIGQTVQRLSERKGSHAYRAKKGDKRTAFCLAILELGGVNAFKWEHIDTFTSADELEQKEKYWTAFYKADDPQYGYSGQSGGIHYTPSAETRRKMSERFKGEKNPMYGRHLTPWNKGMRGVQKHSEETRRKISEAGKGKQAGEKHPMFGKHLSEETKRKLSEANKGKTITEEQRKKLSEALKGKRHSEETKRKIAETHRLNMYRGVAKLTPETVCAIREQIKNGKSNNEIARLFSVGKRTVSDIKCGRHYAWVTAV